MSSSSSGPPAVTAAAMQAAPAGSTPTTRTDGCRSRSHASEPASRPPPPTGTTRTSGGPPSCPMASATTVPWPAIVRGSSKAGTRVAPVLAACSYAAAAASS